MDSKKYFKEVTEKTDKMSDEEFLNMLNESGFAKEENKDCSSCENKWISTKAMLPQKSDADKYDNVIAWRLGRAMIIKYNEVIPENASHWMPTPKEPVNNN